MNPAEPEGDNPHTASGPEADEVGPSPAEAGPGKPRKPRIWPSISLPFLAILLAFLLQAIFGVMVAVMVAGGADPAQLQTEIMGWVTTPVGFLGLLLCGQLAFALPTLAAAAMSPEPMWRRLGYLPLKNPVRTSAVMALGSLLPLAFCFLLVHLMTVWMPWIPTDETFLNFFENITPGWGIVFVLVIALSPGFVEEMLFRGYIQQRLLARWRPAWAIGVTSILFGLVHLAPHTVVLATVLGVWLGVIAWRTGSIVPTIVCHAFVNGAVNAWRLVVKFGEIPESVQWVCVGVFLVIGVVFFVIACRMLAALPSQPGNQGGTQHEHQQDSGHVG